MRSKQTAEHVRLAEARDGRKWRRWGTYLSERQWGTVREDYSPNGDAWGYFPHDHARSRAYRWGEDGLLGFCDNRGILNFSLALWNHADPYLKERLFGLAGPEGNHGEDAKEIYYYLDALPTHSYAKALYKYPQREFPYERLRQMAREAGRTQVEPEIFDTGAFDEDRYFDVYVEYAKADVDDVLVRVTVENRGPETAPLELLAQLWFRNTWSWTLEGQKKGAPGRPELRAIRATADAQVIETNDPHLGKRWLYAEGSGGGKSLPELLFTENETNTQALYGVPNRQPFVKDAFHAHVALGVRNAVNPARAGTKGAARWSLKLEPGQSIVLRMRLTNGQLTQPFEGFDAAFAARIQETDEFYDAVTPRDVTEERRRIFRQAMAGLLWTKQFYFFDVERWLRGDPVHPPPPPERTRGRNREWRHLYNSEVLSMPDKWEYPWYAAWDLAFHCIPLALVDPDFAKQQLRLLTREWYMHPNGQLPAYEWAFGDVNPPVHAWAAYRVYQIDRRINGKADYEFLESVFHKLMLNFTWWVNRKDAQGNNVFQGGFLGLDNIGVFDRSNAIGELEQADATSWMGMYCLNLLSISLELAAQNPSYQDVANKFFEHFLLIGSAMNSDDPESVRLWDEQDGFFYDVLRLPDGSTSPLRVRSMVGLIPLFAVEVVESAVLDLFPAFVKRALWFIENRPELAGRVTSIEDRGYGQRRLMSILDRDRLARVLSRLLDEDEFLSPYGIRALSRSHKAQPYEIDIGGQRFRVDYEPGESQTGLFGGNSNWRGPVWLPVNYLIIESLQKYHFFYGDDFQVECPTGSGNLMNLWEVACEISRRLVSLFERAPDGRRPSDGRFDKIQKDPHFRDHILFYEYFHGDDGAGLGASHQTGWTALVAKLIQQSPLWKEKSGKPRRSLQPSLVPNANLQSER
jgi:hypothetical protein